MKIITNPHTKDVETIYGPAGHGKKYIIKSGESVSFSDADEPIANHFLEIYGFLQVKTVEVKPETVNPLACQYCGYIAKSHLGRYSHERWCKDKTEKVVIEITPEKTTQVVNRSVAEVSGFGNTDGLGRGTKTTEVIGNRRQEIVYDRDGVGWYGPGLEVDMPLTKNRPGRF